MIKSHKKRMSYLTKLIDEAKALLSLQEWVISISVAKADSESSIPVRANEVVNAEILVIYPYKTASITVFDNFWLGDRSAQRLTIMHELSHCLTQRLSDYCHDFANGKYHTPQDVQDEVETLTQRIALLAIKAVK